MELYKLIKTYQNNAKKPITFDFKNAYSSLYGLSNNNINFHYIHFYPGRVYPYIPRYLLSLQDLQEMKGVLLDPFAGSGTILLESLINPFVQRDAWGIEINPIGRLISKVKFTVFDISTIPKWMEKIYEMYSKVDKKTDIEEVIPTYKNLNVWFSQNAIYELAKLRFAIQHIDAEKDTKDFFWLCFSSIIRKVSKADPYIPPPVILKLEKYRHTSKFEKLKEHLEQTESPNVWKIFEESVINNSKKLEGIFDIIRNNSVNGKIMWDDAREIKMGNLLERGYIDKNDSKRVPSDSIDIIFTSPPYLTAQKYIRTFKLELLWLGYRAEEISELEKNSIGSERISLSDRRIEKLGFKDIDKLVEKTFNKTKNRAYSIYFYFKNMIEVIKELHRVLKNGGYMVLVVGDNKVLGEWIGTYKLLDDIAVNLGFKELVVLKDRIKSRSMITKRNGSGGLIKEEYVMIFQKEV